MFMLFFSAGVTKTYKQFRLMTKTESKITAKVNTGGR